MRMEKKSILSFVGNGDGFATKRSNTCAYLEAGKDLIVIDCGFDAFAKLRDVGLFDGKANVHFFITHLHCDHAGSLAVAVSYLYHKVFDGCASRIRVHFPNASIVDFLRAQGVGEDEYYFNINRWDEIEIGDDHKLEYIFEENDHDDNLSVNGISGTWSVELVSTGRYNIYYGGDSAGVKDRITRTRIYDEIYHEVCSVKTQGHTSYEELKDAFSHFTRSERARIWLMHMDDDFDEQQAVDDGFNVTATCL